MIINNLNTKHIIEKYGIEESSIRDKSCTFKNTKQIQENYIETWGYQLNITQQKLKQIK